MQPETVLITGASSGIGLELARLFAAEGCGLVLVARSRDKLDALADELRRAHGVSVRVLPADLSDPAAADQLVAVLDRDDVAVDILVNNAGFGARGLFVEQDARRQHAMIQLNVIALAHLTRRLLPAMLQRHHGGVLNVASIAAFQPGPNMAVYYATKAFVLSLSEALYEEVRGSGVTVSCLAPGPTTTGFAAVADMERTPLFRRGAMDAADVARAGHRGFRRGRSLVVPGLRNWVTAFGVRLLPRWLVRKIVRRLQS